MKMPFETFQELVCKGTNRLRIPLEVPWQGFEGTPKPTLMHMRILCSRCWDRDIPSAKELSRMGLPPAYVLEPTIVELERHVWVGPEAHSMRPKVYCVFVGQCRDCLTIHYAISGPHEKVPT